MVAAPPQSVTRLCILSVSIGISICTIAAWVTEFRFAIEVDEQVGADDRWFRLTLPAG